MASATDLPSRRLLNGFVDYTAAFPVRNATVDDSTLEDDLGWRHGEAERPLPAPDLQPQPGRRAQRGPGPSHARLDPGAGVGGHRPLPRHPALQRQLLLHRAVHRVGPGSNSSAPTRLIAFSRGFDLPIGWFFLPPPPEQDAGLHTADATWRGIGHVAPARRRLGYRHTAARPGAKRSSSTPPPPPSHKRTAPGPARGHAATAERPLRPAQPR